MLTVRLNHEQERQLEQISQVRHESKSELVKRALELYFQTLQNEERAAYETGKALFGRYRSDRGDGSTTYKQTLKAKLRAKNAH